MVGILNGGYFGLILSSAALVICLFCYLIIFTIAGPYTLFVPTDRAFDALPDVVTQKIMSNTTVFKHILLSHITSGILVGPQIFNGQVINSLSGRQLHMGRMANGVSMALVP